MVPWVVLISTTYSPTIRSLPNIRIDNIFYINCDPVTSSGKLDVSLKLKANK